MLGRNTLGHQPQYGGHPQPQTPGHPQEVTYEVHLPTTHDDKRTYPCCECPCPGPHSSTCMFSVYKQMTGNYKMTKDLMTQFINQMTKEPMELEMERQFETAKQEMCRKFCHGSISNPNVRSDKLVMSHRPLMETPNLIKNQCKCANKKNTMQRRQDKFGEGNMQDCMKMLMAEGGAIGPESHNRKLIEDQHRMKNLWVQFMNIFDMALDLAAEASDARWKLNRQRKEDERLACERRIEEARLEWCKKCCNKQSSTQICQQVQKKANDKKPAKDNQTYSNVSEKNHQPETKAQPQPQTKHQSETEIEPETKQNSPEPSVNPSSTSPKPSPKPSIVSDTKPSIRVESEEADVETTEPGPQNILDEKDTEEKTE